MRYYHTAGSNCSPVECFVCGGELTSIYDPTIRDTCDDCGGKSKVAERRKQLRAAMGLEPPRIGPRKGGIETIYGTEQGRP